MGEFILVYLIPNSKWQLNVNFKPEANNIIQTATITYFKQMRRNYVRELKSSARRGAKENMQAKQLSHLWDAKFRVSTRIFLQLTVLTVWFQAKLAGLSL